MKTNCLNLLLLLLALLVNIPLLAQVNSRPINGGIRLSPNTKLVPRTLVTPQGLGQPNDSYRDQMNQVFAGVDRRPITTGLLWDYGLELTDVQKFNGSPNNSNTITLPEWRFLYASLFTMRFNNVNLPAPETLNQRLRNYGTQSQVHQIMALHIRYDQFRSDATSRGVSVNNNRLSCGNTRNPYQTKFAFAAAPAHTILEGSSHRFILHSDLFINRSGKTVSRVDVDPGTGIFATIQVERSFSAYYSTEGQRMFKVRITYTDGTKVESHSPFYVTNIPTNTGNPVARYEGNNIREQRFAATNEAAGALVTVEYAGNDRVLDKPFIVVEGFDTWHITDSDDPDANFSFGDFIGLIGRGEGVGEINIPLATGQTLNDAIEDEEYDLVFIDYDNGTDFIERNAEMVENVIRWVNNQKPNGAEDNVVLGMSMGGLVARMALREMELQGQDHETRLYISHDTPHQGANVPVAAQAAVLHLANMSIGIGAPGLYYNLNLGSIEEGLGNAAALLREPATRQLLQYQVALNPSNRNLVYDNSMHTAFMEEYRRMGMPQDPGIRNIAIASGSECAPGQAFGPYARLLDIDDGFTLNYFVGLAAGVLSAFTNLRPHLFLGFPLTTRTSIRADIELNALPDQQSQRIYRGRIYIRRKILFLVDINLTVTRESLNSTPDMLPLDSSPGGIYDVDRLADLPETVFDIPLAFNHETFSYIPTTSALNIGGDGRNITVADLNARYSPTNPDVDQPFDNFFTNPRANEDHTQFTLDNGQWMLDEMERRPRTFSCTYACGDGAIAPTISGPGQVCGTVTYEVQNANGLPLQWQVNGNLSIVGSRNGTTVQVQARNSSTSGTGRVIVQVGTPPSQCAIRVGQDVSIEGPTPFVTTSNDFLSDGRNNHTATARLLPGTQASNYIWYEDVNNQPGAQLGKGLTLNITIPACTTRFYLLVVNGSCGSRTRGVGYGQCGNNNFVLSPNPASNLLTVTFDSEDEETLSSVTSTTTTNDTEPLQEFAINLYDQQLQMIATNESQDGEAQLDVSGFKTGVYVLHILYQGETYPYSVVIE